ncbi:hypothetical protein evm_008462 [Chilo suppressalis]|nr:hypothetical protein evm_008462 [Chilo suppressalis]
MSLKNLIILNTARNSLFHQLRFMTCWSCGKNLKLVSNLFCLNCNTLQKPDAHYNYFKIMGVNETYDQNETELAKKYRELQKYLHPDKYANKNKDEQEVSEIYSSLVNEAYKTLLEPLARGIYMLKLRGQEMPENSEIGDQAFLMDIMEKNEEVENAETDEEIVRLNKENKAIINELQKSISRAFFDGDLNTVTKLLIRMKYYTSIDNQIQSIIRRKGIIR